MFRVLAGFGLVLLVAVLGSITAGGMLLVAPVRVSRFLDDAFGLPPIRSGARLAPVIVRLVGLGLMFCGCWIAYSVYRAS